MPSLRERAQVVLYPPVSTSDASALRAEVEFWVRYYIRTFGTPHYAVLHPADWSETLEVEGVQVVTDALRALAGRVVIG